MSTETEPRYPNESKGARVLRLLAILLLLALAWLGIKGGIDDWSQSQSMGQKVQSTTQFLYGVLSLLVIWSTLRVGRFHRVVRWAWVVTFSVAGGLAPPVWGGSTWPAGLVAGLAAFGVGLLVLWLLARGTRERHALDPDAASSHH